MSAVERRRKSVPTAKLSHPYLDLGSLTTTLQHHGIHTDDAGTLRESFYSVLTGYGDSRAVYRVRKYKSLFNTISSLPPDNTSSKRTNSANGSLKIESTPCAATPNSSQASSALFPSRQRPGKDRRKNSSAYSLSHSQTSTGRSHSSILSVLASTSIYNSLRRRNLNSKVASSNRRQRLTSIS